MLLKYIFITSLGALLFTSCSNKPANDSKNAGDVQEELRRLSLVLTQAEINDDIRGFLSIYDTGAISMPEYQHTLTGLQQIKSFYKETFNRQNVKIFKRIPDEFIDINGTIVEIGTFHKEFTSSTINSLNIQDGKYCLIWRKFSESNFKLTAETYGFFHPIDRPEELVIRELMNEHPEAYNEEKVPFELRAYNALMEKYVARSGSGARRSEFFTEDGKFFPFAHPSVSGMNEIKSYLIKYDTHGPGFKFDTISVYTHRYEYHEPYILEYPRFFVRWSAPGATGGASGQGIRLWKRQTDHSLKLYREIGTHNLE